MYKQYEDEERSSASGLQPFYSPYQDYRWYESSVTPGIQLGMNVIKPARPGWMLVQLHGWHMSMPQPVRREAPGDSPYLIVQVDMRGRTFSQGAPDCNGLELIDIYDAVAFVRREYAEWLIDAEPVYLEGGSGGGGNVLAAVAKFPDLFAAATALYGISDYAVWYREDAGGEFRDEMDVWIGCAPERDEQRYKARSGISLAPNVLTPLHIVHGDGDLRIPVAHSRAYVAEMKRLGKESLVIYDELPGVGDYGHLTGISADQRLLVAERSERNRAEHRLTPQLPNSGVLYIGGYLIAKPFQVHLETVNCFAIMHYDLPRREHRLFAAAPYRYRIVWSDGRSEAGCCEAFN